MGKSKPSLSKPGVLSNHCWTSSNKVGLFCSALRLCNSSGLNAALQNSSLMCVEQNFQLTQIRVGHNIFDDARTVSDETTHSINNTYLTAETPSRHSNIRNCKL